jgi:hypothetical protein
VLVVVSGVGEVVVSAGWPHAVSVPRTNPIAARAGPLRLTPLDACEQDHHMLSPVDVLD